MSRFILEINAAVTIKFEIPLKISIVKYGNIYCAGEKGTVAWLFIIIIIYYSIKIYMYVVTPRHVQTPLVDGLHHSKSSFIYSYDI